MKSIPLSKLQQANAFVLRDYTLDYRSSSIPAELPLELLTDSERQQAFQQVRARLAIPLDTLHEIYASIVNGKHILLYGPPGTGKTTLAGLLAASLFNCDARFETAAADWTPFETIGGLRLVARDGREYLEPVPGVITAAIVSCLNRIATYSFGDSKMQGTWLVLDELNRANMDAAFGQIFTALDQEHPQVSLPFFDEWRRSLIVPKRFRIVGTMNTYDKNFLFRLSYALTRRFALIPVDVPANSDAEARKDEQEKLWFNLQRALNERGLRDATVGDLRCDYDESVMDPLYNQLITMIRESPRIRSEGLGRSIGFAQIAAALRHAVFEVELHLVGKDESLDALDRGVRSAIVPQLEGLSNTALQSFLAWWQGHQTLGKMRRSMQAVGELIRGASLFLTD